MERRNVCIKIAITIVIIGLFTWFLILSPMLIFKRNENKIKNAAIRYFELHQNELPTGKKVKTLSLQTLYHKSFFKKNFFVPYSKKVCSIENSWVKVRKESGNYHYYVYLECDLLKSRVDHVGPVIKLNGEKKMTIHLGSSYKEPGVYSIVDDFDGKIDTKNIILKGKVNTDKVGVYTLTYTAVDRLNNKRTVERKVEVVQELYSTIKKRLDGRKIFVGNPDNNYVMFSNMLFRIYGVDNAKNIRIVSNQDISNVNFSSLDKWLDYYYDHLMEDSKKMIVDTKYCNMTLTSSTLDTTQCNFYTKKRKIYVPSVIDVNLADKNNENFMRTKTMSWLSNKNDLQNVYLTRNIFYDSLYGKTYVAADKNENYGVRPMITIKGDSLIVSGDGSLEKPYILNDYHAVKPGTLISNRYSGEYVMIGDLLFRIIEVMEDQTVKIISDLSLKPNGKYLIFKADVMKTNIYDVDKSDNLGYYINNEVSEYMDTSYFVNHIITVPIYENNIMYGKELSTKKYLAKLAAPDMYDLFSASNDINQSYWFINSSKNRKYIGGVYDAGVPINNELTRDMDLGIRVVAYLRQGLEISSGYGTYYSPFQF